MNTRVEKVMGEEDLKQVIKEIARKVRDRHQDLQEIILVGIKTRGVPLAERLSMELKSLGFKRISVGALDITFYRDDLSRMYPVPEVKGTNLNFKIDGKVVLLVDDVIYTGRTVRAAMDELLDYGRPDRIEFAVMVDRGERELPICPDYVGRKLEAESGDTVEVKVRPVDEEDAVYIVLKGE